MINANDGRMIMKIVSVEQMRTIEKEADARGLSYRTMMENAGRRIADWVLQNLDVQKGVIGLIGSGNNGGDTIIALTWLAKWGIRTFAFLAKQREGDILLDEYRLHGGTVVDISKNENLDIFKAALTKNVIVLDGFLGTGFKLPLKGGLYNVMRNIHKLLKNRLDLLTIAVDCPSGVDCDTGETSESTLSAEHTLSLAAIKKGLLAHPARSFAGKLHLIDIGTGDPTVYIHEDLPVMIGTSLIESIFPERPDNGHKGTFGTCLVIAGSSSFVGAAYLTGKAAYRAGCGLVHMGVVRDVYNALAGKLIESVWTILPDIDGRFDPEHFSNLGSALENANAVVIGPGWGVCEINTIFLEKFLRSYSYSAPLLIDADALKLLINFDKWWTLLPDHVVLTPHPGEMSVLTGLTTSEIQANRWQIAREYADLWQVNLVLKGAMTVVAIPNHQTYINPVSEPALATAGSGDVLSGVIGGLTAQGLSPEHASILGVWLHSNAGEIAKAHYKTDMSVTALDVLYFLPDAIVKAKEAGKNTSLNT
jgi:NAD(P)H-hydrate epimerase